jgi:hypothetical protein
MRVSYIRKIKDQIPLSQSELNVVKFTLMNAIQHHNAGVIEPLLTRGVPLLLVLYNSKTMLRNAFEANSPKIIEMLMIESMRTFQLFPVNDIIDCFKWVFEKKQYHLVDLMLFAVKQHPKSQKEFGKIMMAIDAMEKLVDLYKKNEVQSYHLKEFESVLTELLFNKSIFFYFYYRWEKEIGDKFTDSVECYRTLADFYLKKDLEQRTFSLNTQMLSIGFIALGSLAFLSAAALFFHMELANSEIYLSTILGLGLLVATFRSLSSFAKHRKVTQDAIRDRILMKACRDGDYGKVSNLIQAGAHVNCLCGIGETTAYYEATLFRNQSIANLLQQFNAYSGQGSETLLFP